MIDKQWQRLTDKDWLTKIDWQRLSDKDWHRLSKIIQDCQRLTNIDKDRQRDDKD